MYAAASSYVWEPTCTRSVQYTRSTEPPALEISSVSAHGWDDKRRPNTYWCLQVGLATEKQTDGRTTIVNAFAVNSDKTLIYLFILCKVTEYVDLVITVRSLQAYRQ